MAREPKCYRCKDAFPYLMTVMEQLCQRNGEAAHDAIVEGLMKHPDASAFIEQAVGRCSHLSKLHVVSNMVQFMSQHYTMDIKDADVFRKRFDRRQDGKGD